MGLFVEDLLNFGNLIDAEIEVYLTQDILKSAYPNLNFELEDGLLKIQMETKGFLFKKKREIRLSENTNSVKNDRNTGRRYILMRALTKDLPKDDIFLVDGELFGIDVWPAVKLTEVYERVPKQFKERLAISRYKIKKDGIKLFLRVEK
ncbi:MAG: hypothetical protein ACP5P0_03535 [Hydrogenobacter sp.]